MHCRYDRSCRLICAEKFFLSPIIELGIMAIDTTSPVTLLGYNAGSRNLGIQYGQQSSRHACLPLSADVG